MGTRGPEQGVSAEPGSGFEEYAERFSALQEARWLLNPDFSNVREKLDEELRPLTELESPQGSGTDLLSARDEHGICVGREDSAMYARRLELAIINVFNGTKVSLGFVQNVMELADVPPMHTFSALGRLCDNPEVEAEINSYGEYSFPDENGVVVEID